MQQPIQLRKSHENVSVTCLKMNGLMRMVAIAPSDFFTQKTCIL